MVDVWRKAIVHELCEITSSKRIHVADYQPEGIRFYRGKEIIERQKGNLEVSTELFISENQFREIKNKFGVPLPGDLLLTSVGTLGVPYVVKAGEEFYFKDGNLTWFRNFKNLDSVFLYYWLLSPQGKAELKKCTIGSSQSAFTIVLLKDMTIELPPLPIQRRIASILSAYDDLIENNTRRIKILEQMAQAIYREWFVEFRAPGVKLRQATPEEQKVTGKDQFPAGWEIRPIGEIVITLGGGTPSTKNPEYWEDGNITWFTPSDLTAAGSMFINEASKQITQLGFDKSSAHLFPAYSVMMTSRATIGVTSINTKEACTNQGFIVCIPNERLSAYQIYYWIAQNKEKIINIASGATYKEINRGEFRELPIPVVDAATYTRFVETVEPVAKLIENLLNKNANLRQTRDLLLPRLVAGEIRIEPSADACGETD